MIDELEVNDFLEHHGIKGQKWGVRNVANVIGRGAKRSTFAVGRGAKKTGQFVRRHPKGTATVAASIAIGAALAGRVISVNKTTKIADIANRNRSEALRDIRMLDQFRDVKIRAIMNARAKGTISPEHASRLASLRTHDYIRKYNTVRQRLT